MRKKVNWWWVVATHERGTVSPVEADAMDMLDFMDFHVAAKVFTSFSDAIMWTSTIERQNCVPEGIQLRVLNDEAWTFAQERYFSGKLDGRLSR